MAKTKKLKINKNDSEIHLPVAVIQHIQSFLERKQAAQTSVVSKSWYNAWLTRPNLDLNDLDFQDRGLRNSRSVNAFKKFARKTIQRYEDLNQKIECFRLQVDTSWSFSNELLMKVAKMGIKDIDFLGHFSGSALSSRVLESETLVKLSLANGSIYQSPSGMVNHSKLRSLTLKRMNIHGECFSLTFPYLEDFTLESCLVRPPINISSSTLKRIHIRYVKKLRAEFDVPNIHKFEYVELYHINKFPLWSFSTIPKEMESDISLCVSDPDLTRDSWYHQVRRLMEKLSGSKISLCISCKADSCVYMGERTSKHGPVVENLMILPPFPWPTLERSCFLANLLWSCPPKFITLEWYHRPSFMEWKKRATNAFIEFLYKELIHGCKQCRNENLILFHGLGLGEVGLECFNMTLLEWQPILLETLLCASNCTTEKQKIRFQLEWYSALSPATANESVALLPNKEPLCPPASNTSGAQPQPLLASGPSTCTRHQRFDPTSV